MKQLLFHLIHRSLEIVGLFLVIFVFSAFGQISNETNILQVNQSLNRELHGGETHIYKLKLKAGQFAQFTVEQTNIDVIVDLYAPDGKLQTELSSQGGELWRETISAVNDFDSEYKIEIKSVQKAALAGNYEIKLNELRPGGEKDVKRVVAEIFLNYGRKSNEVRDFELSVKQLEASLKLWRDIGDRYWEAITLLNIGWGLNDFGENEKSVDTLNQALQIFREIKEKIGETKVLSALGTAYSDLSKYETAINYYQQAVTIAREINLKRTEAILYINLGNIHKNLSLFEKALDYYKQSLQIFEEIKETYNKEQLLNNIGVIYSDLGNINEALNYFQVALKICQETDNIPVMRNIFNNMGNVFSDVEKYENAEWAYQNALKYTRELKDRPREATTLNNLGSVYLFTKQYDKSRGYFEQSLAISRQLKDLDTESFALKNLLMLYSETKNSQLAIFYGKQTINVFQEIRANIKNLDKETQKTYLQGKEKYYRILSDVLISEGRVPEAQAVLDLLKEEEYGQINVRRSGELAENLPYSKTETDVLAKIENLAALGRKQNDLEKLQKEKGALSAEEQQQLNGVRTEIEAANKAFRLALDALGKSDQSVQDKVSEIQGEKNLQRLLGSLSKELNTGAVALYTVIGSETDKSDSGNGSTEKTHSKFGWIILVTPESRKAYPIDVTDLEQTVFDFRTSLTSDKYNPQSLSEKLYTKLFRQTSDKQKTTLEADLETYLKNYKDKTIMWSLDGVLRYVPMAALHDGKGYLVEKYRNVLFTKQSLLLLNEKDSPKWQALGLGVSEAKTVESAGKKMSFQALDGTKRELQDIVREPSEKTGIIDGMRKMDKDFTKDEALRLWREGNYQVVHIASHFSFNPTDQAESFLLLGDGKLTFADIQDKDNLFGAVDLLTLSACDTATGGNGKESEGFAYLAQSLGAKTVIASLWQVSDAGTPELMIQFYKLRSANPSISKGEAFRQAQLSMLLGKTNSEKPETNKTNRAELVGKNSDTLKLPLFVKDANKPFAHPYYWSSFVLIGNWK